MTSGRDPERVRLAVLRDRTHRLIEVSRAAPTAFPLALSCSPFSSGSSAHNLCWRRHLGPLLRPLGSKFGDPARCISRCRHRQRGNVQHATVLEDSGRFLVDEMVESPSRVKEGTEAALDALEESFARILALTGTVRARVRAVGLDSPGPASADGVIFRRGSTNFGHPSWNGFDLRGHLEHQLGLPVVYNNDGNAAALYAHRLHFGAYSRSRSSVSAIVGTGLGGG